MNGPTQDTSAAMPNLYRCGPVAAPLQPGERVERLPFTTIDLHCHVMTPAVEELVAGQARNQEAIIAQHAALGPQSVSINRERFASLLPRLTTVDKRLADMDAMGVDIQAISPSPTQYHYWAEADVARQIVNLQNDEIERVCTLFPQRFVGLGTVALQHPLLAAAQLDELVRKRGFKGVEISSLVDGIDIADRRFDPFWSKADELGAVVFIHPWGTTVGNRLADFYLMNTVGQPFETTVCLSKLIFGGTLDRHRGVKILAAHGGGYLPPYAGRSDHAHAVRPEAAGCACRPSDYLKRIWYDTIVYNPADIARLAEVVGTDRIVIGTDYPFDMGHYAPSNLVRGLHETAQRQILGANAAVLLGLPAPNAADINTHTADDEGQPTVEGVLEAERRRAEALVAEDLDTLKQLIAPEITHTHTRGVTDDFSAFCHFITQDIRFLEVSRGQLDVRLIGTVAVMTGPQANRVQIRRTGESVLSKSQALQVWAWRDRRWVMIAFQSTTLPADDTDPYSSYAQRR